MIQSEGLSRQDASITAASPQQSMAEAQTQGIGRWRYNHEKHAWKFKWEVLHRWQAAARGVPHKQPWKLHTEGFSESDSGGSVDLAKI